MIKIPVPLKVSPYSIWVDSSVKGLGSALKSSRSSGKALVVTHPYLKNRYGSLISKSLSSAGIESHFHVIPEGEKSKNLKTVENIYKAAVHGHLDRKSWIIAFGGGVVGDTAGFAAATFLRGIPLVQIPTTLLAMVDSSIGGKTGVDLKEAKNYVGAFYQPRLVWIHVPWLKSLPAREFRNGMAEVIKYGIIRDAKLFESLEAEAPSIQTDSGALTSVIARCAQIKAQVVTKDEKETKGLREILNFGHTWGHAIETFGGYNAYKHGEAISIGMCAAGWMAVKLGIWSKEELTRLEDLLDRTLLPVKLSQKLPASPLFQILRRDKKNRQGKLRFILPQKIGNATAREVSPQLALEGLKYVQP